MASLDVVNSPVAIVEPDAQATKRARRNTCGGSEHRMTSQNPFNGSPPSQASQPTGGRFHEEWSLSSRGSSLMNDSRYSSPFPLKPRKLSQRRGASRSASRRSTMAASVQNLKYQLNAESNSAFFSPIPTTGNPTELLADRFQAWRKVLKEIITYFGEIQASHDSRAKSLLKASSILDQSAVPSMFLSSGGISDAAEILRHHQQTSIKEAARSREIENEVINALIGLRKDLQHKIREIKNLSGDFKSSIDIEMEATRREINELLEVLELAEIDPSQIVGKKDPYLLKLAVDHQIEKQIAEENYLHQAYLNLEISGRELEAIIVGEIQKSYSAYATILKREAEVARITAEKLDHGPLVSPKDHEWNHFISSCKEFVDPKIPVRQSQEIQYPGKENELAQEIRSGLMERKSKYLKSFTAGWYVVSPTHLHEFKTADKTQPPVLSLYLPDQRLGSHSDVDSRSNKFTLKGRQTGTMHLGHSWVFRCESRETMISWYETLKMLTERSPKERDAFVRRHVRSSSDTLQRAISVGSSDDFLDDDDDDEPFMGSNQGLEDQAPLKSATQGQSRPRGRFPSSDLLTDAETPRLSRAPLSETSEDSGSRILQDLSLVDGNVPGTDADWSNQQPGEIVPMSHLQMEQEPQNPLIIEAQCAPSAKNNTVAYESPENGSRTVEEADDMMASTGTEGQSSRNQEVSSVPSLHVPGEWTRTNEKIDGDIEVAKSKI